MAELEFQGITTLREANDFLKNHFIPAYNLQFSVHAQEQEKAYRKNVFGNLDLIFCKKVQRKVMVGNVFSWENMTWMIDEIKSYSGREINVNFHLNSTYSFDLMGRKVHCKVACRNRLNDYGISRN